MLFFSSPPRMAVYIGTMLRFLTLSSLEHERAAFPYVETIKQTTSLMYSAMRPPAMGSSPNSASLLCRRPCASTCVTFLRHTSSILRCLDLMLPSIRHSLQLSDTCQGIGRGIYFRLHLRRMKLMTYFVA